MPQWIGAITAACAALFAIWKTTVELKRWRVERRVTKQAEVAGEVLATTLRFLSDVKANTSMAIRTTDAAGEAGQAEHERFALAIESRWTQLRPTHDRFMEAWAKAETYLSDEVNKVLERISDEQRSIWSAQVTSIGLPRGSAREIWADGFGSAPQTRLDELRDEVRKLLRPIAQLHGN
jgi:hypothetical protein